MSGEARSPGITYQQLLDTDSRPVPDVLRDAAGSAGSAASVAAAAALVMLGKARYSIPFDQISVLRY